MERSKRRRGLFEKLATQQRKLFSRLGDCTILYLRNHGRVIERVPAFWRDLVNAPDRSRSDDRSGKMLC
jgi:hypothetical protein